MYLFYTPCCRDRLWCLEIFFFRIVWGSDKIFIFFSFSLFSLFRIIRKLCNILLQCTEKKGGRVLERNQRFISMCPFQSCRRLFRKIFWDTWCVSWSFRRAWMFKNTFYSDATSLNLHCQFISMLSVRMSYLLLRNRKCLFGFYDGKPFMFLLKISSPFNCLWVNPKLVRHSCQCEL